MASEKEKEKLLVVLGPTASGKTSLAISLAKKLNTEIISGDSMLVYRGFNIGSAKPDAAERDGVIHHMIDILPPDAEFNVTDFIARVKPIIYRLNTEGKIPILCGGTGLYIKSLVEGYQFNETGGDPEYRQYLENLAAQKGREYVHDLLRQVNPEVAARLHVNNFRRIVRALEVYHLGGEAISTERSSEPIYDLYALGIDWERSTLYDRINRRVDLMLEQDLEGEVRDLLSSGLPADCQAMKGIGYREIVAYINGYMTLVEAIEKIKQNTRHFAKRQLTWYRKMPYIHWYTSVLLTDNSMPEKIYNDLAGFWHLV